MDGTNLDVSHFQAKKKRVSANFKISVTLFLLFLVHQKVTVSKPCLFLCLMPCMTSSLCAYVNKKNLTCVFGPECLQLSRRLNDMNRDVVV